MYLNNIILGRRIRVIRNSLKLDQKQFAKKLDITVSALSNWECGRNKPKEMFLEKIAALGNTTVDKMMDREVVDYQQLYEQQKQRADELEKNLNLINSSQDNLVNELQQALSESNKRTDELEEKIDKNKRLHDAAIKSAGILFSDEKQRADELEKRWHKMKEILDGIWKYGDADEHEIAYDLLNRIQQLEENNNA